MVAHFAALVKSLPTAGPTESSPANVNLLFGIDLLSSSWIKAEMFFPFFSVTPTFTSSNLPELSGFD